MSDRIPSSEIVRRGIRQRDLYWDQQRQQIGIHGNAFVLSRKDDGELSVFRAAGESRRLIGPPEGTRAVQLPGTAIRSQFPAAFGRPARTLACEREPTLSRRSRSSSGLSIRSLSRNGRLSGRRAHSRTSYSTYSMPLDLTNAR